MEHSTLSDGKLVGEHATYTSPRCIRFQANCSKIKIPVNVFENAPKTVTIKYGQNTIVRDAPVLRVYSRLEWSDNLKHWAGMEIPGGNLICVYEKESGTVIDIALTLRYKSAATTAPFMIEYKGGCQQCVYDFELNFTF